MQVEIVYDISAHDLSHNSLQLFLLYLALGIPMLKISDEFSYGV
jgi:hypothetical protein